MKTPIVSNFSFDPEDLESYLDSLDANEPLDFTTTLPTTRLAVVEAQTSELLPLVNASSLVVAATPWDPKTRFVSRVAAEAPWVVAALVVGLVVGVLVWVAALLVVDAAKALRCRPKAQEASTPSVSEQDNVADVDKHKK
jgi:hypothetical protein